RRKRFLASTLELIPAPQGHSSLRRTLSRPLWVLLAATAVLLGLACLNVASLFLARGSARDREISTRLARGASRGLIGRQLLAVRMSLITALRERGDAAFGGVRLRKGIVTVQIALSLILVIGALSFVRTLTGLLAKGPGFVTSSVVSFRLDPRRNGYSPSEAGQLIRRV